MADSNINLAHALELEDRGDYSGAQRTYRSLLERDPSNADLLNGHATACFNIGKYTDAAADFTKAIALAPHSADLIARLARTYFMLGQLARSDECFARALALAPDRHDIRDTWQTHKSQPFFGAAGGFQGSHAPERQVFMSAVVDLLKDAAPHLSILEIGSYMGASLLTWANAVERLHGGAATVVCVDPWGLGDTAPQYDEAMAAALVSNQAYEIFLHNAALVSKRITVRHTRDLSENALPPLHDGTFDIVYVDGCHYYREALFDISEGRRLVKEGGILCGDDLELQHEDCDLDYARRHARADYVRDPMSGIKFHPGVTLAVHEALGRVSSFSGFWAMRKEGTRFAEVSFANARGVAPRHWPDQFIGQIKTYFSTSSELGHLVN